MSTHEPHERDGVAEPGPESHGLEHQDSEQTAPDEAGPEQTGPGESSADDTSTQVAGFGEIGDEEPGAEVEDAVEDDDPVRAAGGETGEERRIVESLDRSRVRRAPRYRNFAVLGGLIGVVLAAIVTPFADSTQYLGHGGLFVVVALTLAPVGILLACLTALLLDRRAR
ncbi:hypothetical protein LQF12_14275 [Ruania suaedae]|uniref:hypothetical protein n=1 Tax=Ruania suaedae TaxID=2897774 RepID=UPI001E3A40C1|nr:hypothetical protein [Ruania suaedae]UFU02634.1 hypothetical protein LQF12_14275 [Ruania suaedae]